MNSLSRRIRLYNGRTRYCSFIYKNSQNVNKNAFTFKNCVDFFNISTVQFLFDMGFFKGCATIKTLNKNAIGVLLFHVAFSPSSWMIFMVRTSKWTEQFGRLQILSQQR